MQWLSRHGDCVQNFFVFGNTRFNFCRVTDGWLCLVSWSKLGDLVWGILLLNLIY